jgi:hypothetical protein
MADASRLGGLVDESATPRYTIVIGAFRERSNAQKLAAQAQAAGFPAQLMECKRGMIAVGVCPSDRIARTFEDFTKLRKEAFCPKDSWILLNE